MIRSTNRQMTRLFFVLVLAMALFGGWVTSQNWQIQPEDLEVATTTSEDFDWMAMLSELGEEAVLLFLGLASP